MADGWHTISHLTFIGSHALPPINKKLSHHSVTGNPAIGGSFVASLFKNLQL
jgi:hypothetical protein